jgi:signal transduction histidine kinase
MNVSIEGQLHPILLNFKSKPLEQSYGEWGIARLKNEYYAGLIASAATFGIIFALDTVVLQRFEWFVFLLTCVFAPLHSMTFIALVKYGNVGNRRQLDFWSGLFMALGQMPQFFLAFKFPELGGHFLFTNVVLSIIGNCGLTSLNFRFILPIVLAVLATYLVKATCFDTLSPSETVYHCAMASIFTVIGLASGNVIERATRVHYVNQLQLETKQQELMAKNKELEQFAYIASHDLQEPLRSVTSFSQMLNEEYREQVGEDGGQYLDYLMEASNRMRNLIKGLLDYSRLGREAQMGAVNVEAVFHAIVADLHVAITESNADVSAGPLPSIQGYETEFRQLLQNLLSNAIKFRKPNEAPEVRVSAERKGNFWEFSVKDNGIGIAPEHHEKIFLIFQRLHNRSLYEGTGIGLANCRKIVELHGGTIRLESEKNKGSNFIFTIPTR